MNLLCRILMDLILAGTLAACNSPVAPGGRPEIAYRIVGGPRRTSAGKPAAEAGVGCDIQRTPWRGAMLGRFGKCTGSGRSPSTFALSTTLRRGNISVILRSRVRRRR